MMKLNSDGAFELPTLPYANTSGHSGSVTSMERAIRNDKDGTTKANQTVTMQLLYERKEYGMTWKELSDMTGWHHGTASGVLSVLHKQGQYVTRLIERRNRCAIYLFNVPDNVKGRKESVRKQKCCSNCGAPQ